MTEFRKRFWTDLVLCASFLHLIQSTFAYSADIFDGEIAASHEMRHVDVDKDTYTINFNNVAITEMIRFASKITHLNFVFDEADLQFPVTIVSEDPVTAKNVMSALAQVLRTHDLNLVEQDGNLLITRSTRVSAVAPLAGDPHEANAALITRVFRIKNANINTIATILRPMASDTALIEISPETRQLIVTDVTANVEQIGMLLLSLDTPHSSFEVETYTIKHIPPETLIALTKEIVTPFLEGNPLIFVPQSATNSIFIVSTPALIERAMTVLEDLDVPSHSKQIGSAKMVFFYDPINRSADELIGELKDVADRLKKTGNGQTPLKSTIDSVEKVRETGSLLFLTDPQTVVTLKEMLGALDTIPKFLTKSPQVFIYKPQYLTRDQIQAALGDLVSSLKDTHTQADKNLIDAINSLEWNKEMRSFLVVADPASIERLKEVLAIIDSVQKSAGEQPKGFYLYRLQSTQCATVLEQLKGIATKLPTESLQNQNLIDAIQHIHCIEANNALLITGSNEAIDQIKTLVADFDVSGPNAAHAFLSYKPKFLPGPEIVTAVQHFEKELMASGLEDPALLHSLSSVRYVATNDSIIFTGTAESLPRVEQLIESIDTMTALSSFQHIGNATFLIYKIQHAPATHLMSSLKTFGETLKHSDIKDQKLSKAIEGMKWIKETNSLLFTGDETTLQKIDELVKKFDVTAMGGGGGGAGRAAETFVIYTPKYVGGDELVSTLQEFEQNLVNAGVADSHLFDVINNLKWIPSTSSLLISGDQKSIDRVLDLIRAHFDIPGKQFSSPSIESIENTSFLVYKLQYHPGSDIQNALKQIAVNLSKGNQTTTTLSDSIASTQWIQVTNSLLCSGPQDVLVQLKELIQSIDVPLRQVFIEVLLIQTSLNNTQNFGLMWGAQSQYFNKATMATGNFPLFNTPPTTPVNTYQPTLQGINTTTTPAGGVTMRQVPFTQGFDLGVIGDVIMHKGKSFLSLGALVNALQIDADATVVLNPKIIAQDNRQSMIFVGENIPYTGAIVTNNAAQITQTSNIEYRDVGMSLTITPVLGDGDVVTMDIVQDISQVITPATATNSLSLTGITTSHTHMETRVQVPDNYFVALSGMINDQKAQTRTGIPCLGGLPVIGALFSENDRQAQKTNLIIFVRPKIVNTYEEYKKITEHQEWLYKDNARLPVLKEWFDDGIDLVKTPENE